MSRREGHFPPLFVKNFAFLGRLDRFEPETAASGFPFFTGPPPDRLEMQILRMPAWPNAPGDSVHVSSGDTFRLGILVT